MEHAFAGSEGQEIGPAVQVRRRWRQHPAIYPRNGDQARHARRYLGAERC